MSKQTYTGYGDTGKVLEKDSATVEGTDVSGRWNRMIEERVVDDYFGRDETEEQEALQKSLDRFAPDRAQRCIQCGKCTSVCTVHAVDKDYNPRYWVQLARTGRTEELKESTETIWKCVSCFKCTNACPKDVETEKVMKALGEWLNDAVLEEETSPAKFDEEFWSEVFETGRIEEGHLLKNFFEATDQPLMQSWTEEMAKNMMKHLPLTQMLQMGQNFVFQPGTEDWEDTQEALKNYLEEQEEKYHE